MIHYEENYEVLYINFYILPSAKREVIVCERINNSLATGKKIMRA